MMNYLAEKIAALPTWLAIVVLIILAILSPFVTVVLWKWVIVSIFSIAPITYWQAVGLHIFFYWMGLSNSTSES